MGFDRPALVRPLVVVVARRPFAAPGYQPRGTCLFQHGAIILARRSWSIRSFPRTRPHTAGREAPRGGRRCYTLESGM
jgi:hypothetical protein